MKKIFVDFGKKIKNLAEKNFENWREKLARKKNFSQKFAEKISQIKNSAKKIFKKNKK